MENQQLSEKELKKIQELYNAISGLKSSLGELEIQYNLQKNSIFEKYSETERRLKEIVLEIEKEYGKVNLNITNGELTPIEEENKEEELVAAE